MRRRPPRLPKGISFDQARGGYRLRYRDPAGAWRSARAGSLDEAKKRKRQLEEGQGSAAAPTLDALAERYEAERREAGCRDVDRDVSRYRRHVAPVLGAREVGTITPLDVFNVLNSLKQLSAKSVNNVRGVLSAMLALAVFHQYITVNPVREIPRGKLRPAGKRRALRYNASEAVQLMTDKRLPQDRRMLYAIGAMTGMRIGEVCGRRWRDYDPDALPLGSLRVWSQYDDQPLKTASGEDTKERCVPVHPELSSDLAWWRSEGFPLSFGRAATDDDFIVPDPRTMGARTQSQATKAHKRDAQTLGIYVPSRGTHGLRRFFISRARDGGARKDVLERITHNATGDIMDQYTSFEWTPLCEAVSCLDMGLQPESTHGNVIPHRMGGDAVAVPGLVPRATFSPARVVEAVGIENIGFRADSRNYG